MVRIHPDPPLFLRWLQLTGKDPGTIRLRYLHDWGISSAGRAPALQAGGRRFDPVILHQSSMPVLLRQALKEVCGVVKRALAIEPVRVI
jgi:hypothetical protein